MRVNTTRRPCSQLGLPAAVFVGLLSMICGTAAASGSTLVPRLTTVGLAETTKPGPTRTADLATEKLVRKKMGSRFEITALHADRSTAVAAIEAAFAEIDRLELLISSWRPTSQTSEVVQQAGKEPVAVDADLLGLVHRSLKIAELTQGAYDISFAAAGDLWDFKSKSPVLPSREQLEAALELVDYRQVQVDLDKSTVFLPVSGMRIGFGGIGKGFAANRARAILQEFGIANGVVNAGGDLLAFGRQADGTPWNVAIANPKNRDAVFANLAISNQAVVTSGDYESFFEIDGVRYAHILDPRTGYPTKGIVSATVLCRDAELADALATAIFVMGIQEGLALVDRLEGVEALIVTESGDLRFSRNLESSFLPRD